MIGNLSLAEIDREKHRENESDLFQMQIATLLTYIWFCIDNISKILNFARLTGGTLIISSFTVYIGSNKCYFSYGKIDESVVALFPF